jgi:hypothetical protein
LVLGTAPDPFTVAYEEIPVYFRFESGDPLSEGRYGTSLVFEVTVAGAAR